MDRIQNAFCPCRRRMTRRLLCLLLPLFLTASVVRADTVAPDPAAPTDVAESLSREQEAPPVRSAQIPSPELLAAFREGDDCLAYALLRAEADGDPVLEARIIFTVTNHLAQARRFERLVEVSLPFRRRIEELEIATRDDPPELRYLLLLQTGRYYDYMANDRARALGYYLAAEKLQFAHGQLDERVATLQRHYQPLGPGEGEHWHPEFGEVHGYGTEGWFHVSRLGLLRQLGDGWHGHFVPRRAGWVHVGEIHAPGVITDSGFSLFHSTHGWFHLSTKTGLHYRWAEEGWFPEW